MMVKNNAERIRQIGGSPMIQLLPGINVVDPAAWAKAVEIELIKFYIKNGELQVIDAKAESITDKTANEAVKLAGETFNVVLLKTWLEDESRARVIKALQGQLDLINAAGDVPQGDSEKTEG